MSDRNTASSFVAFRSSARTQYPDPLRDRTLKIRNSRGRDLRDEASQSERSFTRPRQLVFSNPPPRGQRSRPVLSRLSPTDSDSRSERSEPRQRSLRHKTLPASDPALPASRCSSIGPLARAYRISASDWHPCQCLPEQTIRFSVRSPTTCVFGSSFPDRFCLPSLQIGRAHV